MLLFSWKRKQSQRGQGTCSKPHSCSQPPGSQLSAHFAAFWSWRAGGWGVGVFVKDDRDLRVPGLDSQLGCFIILGPQASS